MFTHAMEFFQVHKNDSGGQNLMTMAFFISLESSWNLNV